MTEPRFLRKYREEAIASDPDQVISKFLEGLDLADWSAMLDELLVTQSADIYEVIAPAPGSGLLDYAASLFEEASPASLKNFVVAAERILFRTRNRYEDPQGREIASNCLRLLAMLEDVAPADGALDLVTDADIPPEIRLQAALLFCDRPDVHIGWRKLGDEAGPSLLPAVITALSVQEPVEAIHALVAASHVPDSVDMIEYPLRITVRRLIRDEGIARTIELLDSVPHHHWGRSYIFDRTLAADEFAGLLERIDQRSVVAHPLHSGSNQEADPEVDQDVEPSGEMSYDEIFTLVANEVNDSGRFRDFCVLAQQTLAHGGV